MVYKTFNLSSSFLDIVMQQFYVGICRQNVKRSNELRAMEMVSSNLDVLMMGVTSRAHMLLASAVAKQRRE